MGDNAKRYAEEVRRLHGADTQFQVTMNIVALCHVLSALQVAYHDKSHGGKACHGFLTVGKALQAQLADQSPRLAAIIDKGWRPNSPKQGVDVGL